MSPLTITKAALEPVNSENNTTSFEEHPVTLQVQSSKASHLQPLHESAMTSTRAGTLPENQRKPQPFELVSKDNNNKKISSKEISISSCSSKAITSKIKKERQSPMNPLSREPHIKTFPTAVYSLPVDKKQTNTSCTDRVASSCFKKMKQEKHCVIPETLSPISDMSWKVSEAPLIDFQDDDELPATIDALYEMIHKDIESDAAYQPPTEKSACPEVKKFDSKSRGKAKRRLYQTSEENEPLFKKISLSKDACISVPSVLPIGRKKVSDIDLTELLNTVGATRKSDLTPRRRKLYDTVLSLKHSLKYYVSMAEKYKGNVDAINKSKYNVVFQLLKESIPAPMSDIIMKQIKYRGESEKESHGHRWSQSEIFDMLSQYKTSPAGYASLATRINKLPSKSTLSRMLRKICIKPGFNQSMFDHAGYVTQSFDFFWRVVVLLFDETSLKKHLSLNLGEGQIDGFADYGEEEGERPAEIANVAQIFMAQSINGEWKLPLLYSYALSSTPADVLQRMLARTVRKAREQRLIVIASSCDQGGNNRRALRLLGANFENPVFVIDGEPVVAIFDACHLLKATRRGLRSNQIKYKSHKLLWSDLYDTLLYDQSKEVKVKLLTHLDNEKHFNFNSHLAMRVSLAAQVCGNKMAVSLNRRANEVDKRLKLISKEIFSLPELERVTAATEKNLASILEERDRLRVTSEAISKINKMFDSLNASNKSTESTALRRPVTSNSPHAQVWESSIEFVESLTFKDSQNREIPTCKNWLWTLRGAQMLKKILLEEMHFTEFYSRSITTDGLENYNGIVKHIAGSASPTTPCFQGALTSSMLGSKNVPMALNKNCEDDNAKLELNATFMLNWKGNEPVIDVIVAEKISILVPEDTAENIELSFFVCKKVLQKLVTKDLCQGCKDTVVDDSRLDSVERKLLKELECNVDQSFKVSPNKTFARYFFYCSDMVDQLLPERAHRRRVFILLQRLVLALYSFKDIGCATHALDFQSKFVKEVVIECADRYCKHVNMRIKEEEDEKKRLNKEVLEKKRLEKRSKK